jgi:hypothetical protein
MFVAVLTTARHLLLFWRTSFTCFSNISFKFIVPTKFRPFEWKLCQVSPPELSTHFSSPHLCHLPHPYHPPWFHHSNITRSGVKPLSCSLRSLFISFATYGPFGLCIIPSAVLSNISTHVRNLTWSTKVHTFVTTLTSHVFKTAHGIKQNLINKINPQTNNFLMCVQKTLTSVLKLRTLNSLC